MSILAPVESAASPYPGLRPFEAHEAHLFFGRDEQIDELLRRLRHHRFLAVVGTSGCGKSSLVKAGLLPNLQGGGMVTAGSAWRIASMRPGADPFGNLAAALNAPEVFGSGVHIEGELPATAFTEAALRRGPLGLVDVTSQFRLPPNENLLLLVDQFEEIFRFAPLAAARRRDDAAAFVKLLLEGAAQHAQSIYVVLTMRSDFIGDCARFRGLPEAINEGQYLVPRLTRSQLREAIEGPAAVGGAKVSPPLVQALLTEVGDDQDRLPLLQHALMRTWNLRPTPDTLDLPSYTATGGMAHALSRHADEAYDELAPRAQEIATRLFQRLTHGRASGRGTRRPSRLREICEVVEAPLDEVIHVVEVFRRPDRSFLMPPHGVPLTPDSTLDISHESLMRQWGRLREWTQKEYESAVQYRRLSEAAALHEQGRAGLWRNPELDIALRWKGTQRPTAAWASRYDAHFDRASAFLNRSRAQLRVRRSIGTAVLLGAVLLVGYVAYESNRRGAENSLRVQVASSLTDPVARALLLAELADVAQPGHLRLYRDAATAAIPLAVLGTAGEPDETWLAAAFAGDGRRLARISSRGTVRWQSTDGRETSTSFELGGQAGEVLRANAADAPGGLALEGVSVTPDGRRLAAFSDNMIYLTDTAGSGVVASIPLADDEPPPTALSLASDHRSLAVAFSDGSVQIWKVGDMEGGVIGRAPDVRHLVRGGGDSVSNLQFDDEGSQLAAGTYSGAVHVWPLDTDGPPVVLGPVSAGVPPALTSLAFSADGRWLVCGYADNVARVWHSSTPGSPLVLQSHHEPVLAVAFSPAPRNGSRLRIVTASQDTSARIWNIRVMSEAGGDAAATLQLESPPMLLAGHSEAVQAVAISPDGSRIATTSADGTTRIWPSEPLEPRIIGQHDSEVESVDFSQDGRLVVTSSRDKTARIWAVDGSARPVVLEGHADWVRGAAFSPIDSTKVVTASEDRTVRTWTVAGASEELTWTTAGRLFAVAFSRDGRRIATGSADNTAAVRTLDHAEPIVLAGHGDWVFDVAFSRDGTRLATAGGDGTAIVWRLPDGQKTVIPVLSDASPDRRVLAAAFSPDGSRVATASADNVAQVWSVQPGTQPGRPELRIRHSAAVNDVVFDEAGRWILTASSDKTARLSDAGTGREIVTLQHPVAVRSAAFDPAGRQVVTGATDGAVRVWLTHIADLAGVLRRSTTACLSSADRIAVLGESAARARSAEAACTAQR